MYSVVKAEEKIRVSPALAKRDIGEAIKEVLKEKYEGKLIRDLGLVVKIIDANPISKGIVVSGDPNIYFTTEFDMITFTIDVNEVYKGVIKDVMDFGAFVIIGPIEALLHISQISKDRFSVNKKDRILEGVNGKKLKKGDIIFAKASTVSMKGSASNIKISLTMRGEGLGKDEWIKEPKEEKKPEKKEKKEKMESDKRRVK
ncbi:MAG: DNA-directed RNA polymerase [Candidatus Micrarchaeota archaeon]|nr:DNA-directed RNA polymerase [Candidatus Micrarchaeota archaeon]